MKAKILAAAALAVLGLAACDNTTDDLGKTITNNADNLSIKTDTFTVSTRSIVADSVLSLNTTAYIGRVRDPETGAYVTGDCMLQFRTLEDYNFPAADSIVSRHDGQIVADSAEIRLYYTDFYGDSLQTMKVRAYELNKPMEETRRYYSNFDPRAHGYVSPDAYHIDRVYTLADLTQSKAERNSSSYNNIRLLLNKPYTSRDGKTYNNYGTYIMQQYYADKSNFRNAYNFIHHVVPGFYFETQSGLGSMAYVTASQLNVYFRYHHGDSVYNGVATFAGTEEVLQTTRFVNDQTTISQLVADDRCTYLKTPAGIFTEMTLPVDDILRGHDNDSINSAKIVINRINNTVTTDYSLGVPQTLLMIPKDQLYTFFERKSLPDYKSSFLATYSSATNSYTFDNLAGMITYLHHHRGGADWNKVVLVPVTTDYKTIGQSSVLTNLFHDMSLRSTRLVGGTANPYQPLTVSVIYSKFE